MAKGGKKKNKKGKKGKLGGGDKFAGARPFCVAPQSTFTVRSFRVHWISADPSYDPRYRLTPIINLFEGEGESRHEGAVAFLQFRMGEDLSGASHDEGSKVYRLDFPLEMADSVLTLLGSGAPLEVAYFEQDKRCWADLRSPFLALGDDEPCCEDPDCDDPDCLDHSIDDAEDDPESNDEDE